MKGQIGDVGQVVSLTATARQGDIASEFTLLTVDRKALQTKRLTSNGSWRMPDDLYVVEPNAFVELAPMAVTAARTDMDVADFMVTGYQFGPG